MVDSSIFVKFDPEKIREVAIILERQYERLTGNLENIKLNSENLTNIWLGDCSKLYLDKIFELCADGEELAKILLSFSQDLNNVSGIYKAGETKAKKKTESLPTEGIFLV